MMAILLTLAFGQLYDEPVYVRPTAVVFNNSMVYRLYHCWTCEPQAWVLGPGQSREIAADYVRIEALPLDSIPDMPRVPLSARADLDGDNDVDLEDMREFQRCFNGPNRPPAC